jgi:hypothetical protein
LEFNFYDQFSSYSTGELLAIVQQPDKYQAEAVGAAELLLKERSVSDAERSDAHQHILALEAESQQRSDQSEARIKKIAELISPTLSPGKAPSVRRLFYLLLAAYGVSYCWGLYGLVRSQLHLFRCEGCRADFGTWLGLILMAYQTVTFFLLVRKRRWGWILAFVNYSAMILPQLYAFYIWYRMAREMPLFSRGDITAAALSVIYPIVMASFLWRRVMTRIFGIDRTTRGYSVLAGVIIGIGVMVLLS